MSLIGFFVRYFFTYVILPLFLAFLIGKPIFLIRILNKFLHFKVNNIEIFHFFLVIFGIFDVYYYLSYRSGRKDVQRIIKNEIINTDEYSVKLSQVHSYERNIYIFLTCIAMLLTMHKFGERILRIDEKEAEKKELEKKLGITEKTPEEKKND